MKMIAVAVARGGSRRVPRKNVQPFCGLPLVAWTLIQAKNSRLIDHVYLSTDDDEIQEIAESYDVEVIRRPDWPDADQAAANRPYLHAIDVLEEKHGMDYGLVQLLPTSPLRFPDDIDRGVAHWEECGGHVIAAHTRRETFIHRKVKDTISRAVLQDKFYQYQDPVSGLVNVVSPGWYRWFVPKMGSDLDADLNAMMRDGEHLQQDFYYVECQPFQVYEVDTPGEFQLCERLMEHFILQGRGPEIYYDYGVNR